MDSLIAAAGLGECNKLNFTNPPLEKTFGVPKQADPEGARELTMLWKEHKANPLDTPGEYLGACFDSSETVSFAITLDRTSCRA